ncbi:MAG: hypothetical protein JWO11_2729 [Nocardioides sp.]|nr:hypothetical protein [Nocardioides sp.]
MAEAFILEFKGVSADKYGAVTSILGLDPVTGAGAWPQGLLSHTGAGGDGDQLVVFEVWDSQAAQEAFMQSRLGPALGQAGLPEPARVQWLSVLGNYAR